MFGHLQISDPVERALVAAADAGLAVATLPSRLRGRQGTGLRGRILVFRFERTGDLIMARPALAALRSLAPEAYIELAIGGWNRYGAPGRPVVDRVSGLDWPGRARGSQTAGIAELRAAVRRWRHERFDVAINLEGDIRSHLLMWATGIPERHGFDMAGGGPVLTHRVPYDPGRHVAWNCLRIVGGVFGQPPGSAPVAMPPRLLPPDGRALVSWLYLAGAGSLVGFSAYMLLLQRTSAALASSYTFVNPIIGLVLGATLGGELISTLEWAAAAVVSTGVVLLLLGRREPVSQDR